MEPIQDVDLTGRTVDRYAIVALIGAGGQGLVYRGRDEGLHRNVAIKVLRPGRPADPTVRRSLIVEARALSRLNHPHVAGIYDFVTHEGRDFMIMEFVPGATLCEVVAGGPLPTVEVLRLGAQMARGLAAAHAASVVHCDIKPSNMKITSSGQLKILDFGVAKLLPAAGVPDDTTRSTSVAAAGTLPYMSPEQLRGETADERSDVFSMGAVLYEMATGCSAFPQRNLARIVEAIQHVEPAAPSTVNPFVPPALEEVITKAMRKESGDRPQSAAALATTLESLTQQPSSRSRRRIECLTRSEPASGCSWQPSQMAPGPSTALRARA